jgi:hypothetical protein
MAFDPGAIDMVFSLKVVYVPVAHQAHQLDAYLSVAGFLTCSKLEKLPEHLFVFGTVSRLVRPLHRRHDRAFRVEMPASTGYEFGEQQNGGALRLAGHHCRMILVQHGEDRGMLFVKGIHTDGITRSPHQQRHRSPWLALIQPNLLQKKAKM